MFQIEISNVRGLPAEEFADLLSLINTYNYYSGKNQIKNKYYEGKISLSVKIPGETLCNVLCHSSSLTASKRMPMITTAIKT